MTPEISEVLSGARRWHVEQGDALAFLRTLPDACIDALVTDPPYSSGGAMRGDRMASTTLKYVNSEVQIERPDFSGDTRDQRAFGYWCALWISEACRVLRSGSLIALFTDWRQLPMTTDALQAGGAVWRGIIPWDKTEAVRPQPSRPRAQAEYIVWGSNGPMPERADVPVTPGCLYFDADDPVVGLEERLPSSLRYGVKQGDKHHITGKPTQVMLQLLDATPPDGVVLDLFGGSMTTVVAALMKGRRAIGCEMVPEYVEIGRTRCQNVEAGHKPEPRSVQQVAFKLS